MKYKIFITVTAQVRDFAALLDQIPDMSLLEIVNNFDNPVVAKLCTKAEKAGAIVHSHPENLGCAGGWNVALRAAIKEQLDYVIILSPSCRWDNNVNDFVQAIDQREAEAPGYFYSAMSQFKSDTHAFALTRRCIDEIGLYDENFWPVYYEDLDYYRRMALCGREVTYIEHLRTSAPLNGGVRSDGRLWRLNLDSIAKNRDYFVEKWGSEISEDQWEHPFNEIDKTVDYCPAPRRELRATLYSVEKFNKLREEGLV